MSGRYSVLMVCMGNICRSPTAEGVFRHAVREAGLAGRIEVASAGTHDYHVGGPADDRSTAHARQRGYDLSGHRARQVSEGDFDRFDLVLAMDHENFALLQEICPPGADDKLRLFMAFAPDGMGEVVPDPYAGGPKGFELVLDQIEAASEGLLRHIRTELGA
ncbi:low molecular weight protein-tyrosine-phosphatase [Ramlibacter pallidus]|uniref:protein-tyrosine-phosphatase n=1 Tax=Ramlibacter pallidus TaxID=2780087 RepID=A0ABR9S4S6_9BURK|nr:low molecular weight protein-tyrosine-phosphatase [Ramlibacter pallidus]MBE7368478.1 low molecular weight phosphotyrosine protein phosphatase [Ramlibacter pallidus]